jgi:PAS domain S-box-containing protein
MKSGKTTPEGAAAGARERHLTGKDRTLFATMTQGVVYQNAEGQIVSANPAAERILGLTLAEMQGRTSGDPRWHTIHEDGTEFPGSEHPSMVALRTGQEVVNTVMGVFHPELGRHTWIRVSAVPQFKPGEDKPYEVYTTFEDLTEQKQVSFELRERIKELGCLRKVLSLAAQKDVTVEDILQQVVNLLPPAWQHPDVTCSTIEWRGCKFSSSPSGCPHDARRQAIDIVVEGKVVGSVGVCYSGQEPEDGGDPFLREEYDLLDTVARHLGDMIGRRESEARSKQLARFPSEDPYPVLRVSSDGAILYCNEPSKALLDHWEKQEGQVLPDSWRLRVGEALQANAVQVAEVEYDGITMSLAFAPVADVGEVNIYGTDVTALKRSEQSLRNSENRFRSITEHATDFIFIKDAERRYTFVNRAMQQLLGVPEEEVLGKTPEDIFGAEQAQLVRALDDRTFSGETVDEIRKLVIGSEQRFFNTVQTPLTEVDGEVTSIMGIVRDVTHIRRAEAREKELRDKLARGDRMQALGVLAGGIAHDFNNLLAPNVALPALILEDLAEVTSAQCPNIDDIRENISAIEQSSLRAAEAIKDIAVLSRAHATRNMPIDINEIVKQYLDSTEFQDLVRARPNVSFDTELTQGSSWTVGTTAHIERLLSNLVRNAMQAIEGNDGGHVMVKTTSVAVEEPIAGYELIEPGEYVVISVEDTGIGIESEMLAKVFEPFFTTRKKANRAGSGLGLAVVHGIVHNHGGVLDVVSEVGKGTTFRAYFPAAPGMEEALKRDLGAVPTGSEHILAVDDEPGQLFIVRAALQRQGYTVAEAVDGHEAVRLFEAADAKGKESPFDLVILDMVMEPGFDGIATLKEIRKLYPDQKAMILSGYASDEAAADEARTLGAKWMTKPWQRDALSRAVRTQLDE